MNIIKLLGRLADLLAPVYSIETLLNLRKRDIESKSLLKEKFMNLKTIALFFLVASASLVAKAQDVSRVIFTASTENLTGPASVEEGYVNLVLENQDNGMRAHGIFRVLHSSTFCPKRENYSARTLQQRPTKRA